MRVSKDYKPEESGSCFSQKIDLWDINKSAMVSLLLFLTDNKIVRLFPHAPGFRQNFNQCSILPLCKSLLDRCFCTKSMNRFVSYIVCKLISY